MSKQEQNKSSKEENEKKERHDELAKVFTENPLSKIEKPAKRTRLFFAAVLFALFFGVAGGILGELAVNYWLLTGAVNLPWFNKLRLDQYLPTKEIIVSKRESVTVAQDAMVSEAVKKLGESQAVFFNKFSADEKGAHIYNEARRAVQGIILTNDGWMAAPLSGLAGQPSEYLGLDARGESFNIKKIIPDRFLGIAYLETDAQNAQPANFADLEKISSGSLAVINDSFKQSARLASIDSMSFNQKAPEEFSDKISRFMALDSDLPQNFFGSGVAMLSGELAGIVLDADSVLRIDYVKSRLKEAIDESKIEQGFLGVSGISQKSFLEKPLLERKGILIGSLDPKGTGIVAKSPAAKAGLRDGDILLSIDNEEFNGAKGLAEIMADYRKGDEVEIKYLRSGKERTVKLKLDALPIK